MPICCVEYGPEPAETYATPRAGHNLQDRELPYNAIRDMFIFKHTFSKLDTPTGFTAS